MPSQSNVNAGTTLLIARVVRSVFLLGVTSFAVNASADTATSKLWSDLKTARETLPALHQEFDVTQTLKSSHGTQESRREIVIDMSQKKWREHTISGAGDRVRIFDGKELYFMDADGDEYVRVNRKGGDDPEPGPYSFDWEWAKAKEIERRPCGFSTNDRTCVIVEVPVKGWVRLGNSGAMTRMSEGVTRLAVDAASGMLVESATQEAIDDGRGGYTVDIMYSMKKSSSGALDDGLFNLPEGAHEVKELSPWNAARLKKTLAGKPAPELEVTDLNGEPVTLSSLKGKTVLLDFWTTWCPPCLADAPALDKLYSKFGGKDLMIVGISVNENRDVVEKFLKKHPHSYPVVLTSENEMPRPYEIAAFPTYMVIAPDGTLTTAMEGDQGFSELRKFLEKAGMDTE